MVSAKIDDDHSPPEDPLAYLQLMFEVFEMKNESVSPSSFE